MIWRCTINRPVSCTEEPHTWIPQDNWNSAFETINAFGVRTRFRRKWPAISGNVSTRALPTTNRWMKFVFPLQLQQQPWQQSAANTIQLHRVVDWDFKWKLVICENLFLRATARVSLSRPLPCAESDSIWNGMWCVEWPAIRYKIIIVVSLAFAFDLFCVHLGPQHTPTKCGRSDSFEHLLIVNTLDSHLSDMHTAHSLVGWPTKIHFRSFAIWIEWIIIENGWMGTGDGSDNCKMERNAFRCFRMHCTPRTFGHFLIVFANSCVCAVIP